MFEGTDAVMDLEAVEAYTKPKKISVSAIAAEAVARTDGDTIEGAKVLLTTIMKEWPEFYQAKASEAMLLWAQEQIRHARTRARHTIACSARGRSAEAGPAARGVKTLADTEQVMYMNWVVLPGITLANATRGDLSAAVEKYRADADVYIRRSGWLNAIAEQLPDDEQTVGHVMNETKVAKLAAKFNI